MTDERHITLPPPVDQDPESKAILGLWTLETTKQTVVAIQALDQDPGVWGIRLVDIAKHAAQAYAEYLPQITYEQALKRILSVFIQELAVPTDNPISTPDQTQ